MNRKKELKAAYKEKKHKSGIYQIKNLVNAKIYIGESKDLEAIWNRIRFQLNMGSHRVSDLQREWKEYGEANFTYEILDVIKAEDGLDIDRELKAAEQMYLEELNPFGERGYNKKKKTQ